MTKPAVELWVDQLLQCGEGPVWDATNQRLCWTDSGGDKVFAATTRQVGYSVILSGTHVASLSINAGGGLMLCGKDGFFSWSESEGVKIICNSCDGIPVSNINDIIADPAGRVFGGQDVYRENEKYETGYLFRIDNNGKATIMEEGLHLANGMGFSPQADKFYLVDTVLRNIYVYDYQLSSGNISNRKIFVELNQEDGLPDGLTVDSEGYVWVARWFGGGLSRYDPDGKLERKIDLPVAQPSSLTFGGADFSEIFITSAAVVWQSLLAPRAHDYTLPRGGGVYRVQQDIQGMPEYYANV